MRDFRWHKEPGVSNPDLSLTSFLFNYIPAFGR